MRSRIKFFWFLPKGFFCLLLVVAGIFALDRVLKEKINCAKDEDFPKKLKGSRGLVEIRRAFNPGFSMGRLGRHPKLVKALSVLATIFLAFALPYMSYTMGDSYLLQKYGMAMVLGGAMSNTYDRVRYGKVTDYLYIRIGVLKKMIINIGDIALYFGGILYALGSLMAWVKNR